jgi:hypothetical protein
VAEDRSELGKVKVGLPLWLAFGAVIEAVEGKGWSPFRADLVRYFFDRVLGHWVPGWIDAAHPGEALESLDPAEVEIFTLLLLRDFFRHNYRILRQGVEDGAWVEALFADVVGEMGLPAERFAAEPQAFELEDLGQLGWAERVGGPLGLKAPQLFVTHAACVTGAAEEAAKKPWWKFW